MEKLVLRFHREQRLDGAISLQEVSRTRAMDVALNAYIARREAELNASTPSAAAAMAATTSVASGKLMFIFSMDQQ